MPGDVSASDRFYARDITSPFVLDDGHIKVPTGPGLGVRPDEALLTFEENLKLADQINDLTAKVDALNGIGALLPSR